MGFERPPFGASEAGLPVKSRGTKVESGGFWSRAAPMGWHLTMRLCDDRVIARTAAELRLASRVLFEHGRTRGLLSFRVVDTHVHALLVCSRDEAGMFARYAQGALRKRLRLVPFEKARIRPILDQSHLRSTFLYVLRQARRHGSSLDPAHE